MCTAVPYCAYLVPDIIVSSGAVQATPDVPALCVCTAPSRLYWYITPGTWYLVPGTWYLVPEIPGTGM